MRGSDHKRKGANKDAKMFGKWFGIASKNGDISIEKLESLYRRIDDLLCQANEVRKRIHTVLAKEAASLTIENDKVDTDGSLDNEIN